jgi:hypothetical protein
MENELGSAVRKALEEGKGEKVGSHAFLPLVTLESDTRVALDGNLDWLAVPPDERTPFVYGEGCEHYLCECLEMKRDVFDTQLETAAKGHGLDPDAVVFAFPVIGLVRSILAKGSPYLTRLALFWLRPTELRDLRADILAVSRMQNIPMPLKELAARLVVPE